MVVFQRYGEWLHCERLCPTYLFSLQATNEEWYARRGYQVIKTVQDYYRVSDKNGKVWDTKTVFMRKDIAGDQ